MASVHLKFIPPDTEDLTKLYIYEGSSKDGPFTIIETVTPVGTFPNYIDEYTTNVATNAADWFAIQWEDSKGARNDISSAVQGGTSTVVSEIVSRVELRDASLKHAVVVQETEAALEYVLAPGTDIFDPTIQLTNLEKRGLTNLTLAMCYLTEMAQTTSSAWVAGIVSMKTSDVSIKQRTDSIQRLIRQANIDLNINFSMIAYLQDVEIAGGTATVESLDQSRLLIEIR